MTCLPQLNPRLIRLSITGFGDTGPLADAPAFDSLIQGRTGIVAAEGRNAGQPAVTPFNMVDKVTGAFGAQAVMAALYEREKTGQGCHVKLPMLDVMGYFNFPDMFQHRTFEGDTSGWKPPQSQVLETRDGYVVISPANGAQMSKTLNAIERPEWKDDFKRMPDPALMAEEFFRRVGAVVKERDTAFWLQRLRRDGRSGCARFRPRRLPERRAGREQPHLQPSRRRPSARSGRRATRPASTIA